MHLLLGCHCVTHTPAAAADPQEAFLRRWRSGTLLSEALSHAGVCWSWSWKPDPFLGHINTVRATSLLLLPPLSTEWDPIVSRLGNGGQGVLHVCAVTVVIGSLAGVMFVSRACREEAVTCAGSQNTAITNIPLRFQSWKRAATKTVTFAAYDEH